jgi:hypothetical protein
MGAGAKMMPSLEPARSSPSKLQGDARSPGAFRLAAILAIGILLTAIIYLPFAARSFDVWDFADFLPLLRNNPTFLTQLEALLHFYVEDQGRLNVVPYFFIVTKWFFFGWHVSVWQTARFLQMWLIVAGVYVVLRDLGVARFGALCGAALFVVAPPGMAAWVRLNLGEPLGTLLLLLATHLAIGYQQENRWRLRANGIVFLLLATAFTKEMLLAAVPFVLALACSRGPDGRFQPLRASHRNRYLIALSVTVLSLAAIAIVWVLLHAKPDAYARQYGKVELSVYQVLAPLILFLLPGYSVIGSIFPRSFVIANEAFLAILAGGWWLAFRSAVDKSEMRRRLVVPLLLLLLGALAYEPWDVLQVTYGLPFLLAPAFLLGYALTSIESYYKRRVVLIRALTMFILMVCAISAHRFARRELAFQRVNAGVAARIAASTAQDSTLVMVGMRPKLAWMGPGPALGRYVLATTGHPVVSPVRDILCVELEPALHANSRLLIVSYHHRCGSLSHPDVSLRHYFHYLDLSNLALRVDSVRADLLFHHPVGASGR